MSLPFSSFLNQSDVRETAVSTKPNGFVAEAGGIGCNGDASSGEMLYKEISIAATSGNNIKISADLNISPYNSGYAQVIKLYKGSTVVRTLYIDITSVCDRLPIAFNYVDENVTAGTQTYYITTETTDPSTHWQILSSYLILEKLK